MTMQICSAPCCWGVDDPKNPYLPNWKTVLSEASIAGYKGIELGPYGYLPLDAQVVNHELEKNHLSIIAGTIFDDLVSKSNFEQLKKQTRDICSLITKLPQPGKYPHQHYQTPYLVLIDWGHDVRDYGAGHSETTPRLSADEWSNMVMQISEISKIAFNDYGVRPVIHHHAGGYIEFADEIDQIAQDINNDIAGLLLDIGHLQYSGMDPVQWLKKYRDRIDYIHFKNINPKVYDAIMQEHIRFFDAVAKGVMCPLNKGLINYKEIYNTLLEIGYEGYITIEQERDPRNSSGSLADVKESREFLLSVGFTN